MGFNSAFKGLNTNMGDGTVVIVVFSVSLVFINLSTEIFVKAVQN
jgi:hypothetical protein